MSTICIIDGGNLRHFPYRIDYKKLYQHVTDELGADPSKVFYIGSIPTHYYFKMYDWLGNEYINLESFNQWVDDFKKICDSPIRFSGFMKEYGKTIRLPDNRDLEEERGNAKIEIERVEKQLRFMFTLKKFGYQIELTPLKEHIST